MQFKTAADGYTIAENYNLESPQKILKLEGQATFDWSNSNLKGIDADTIGKYFALVGQEFWTMYKKKVKDWEKAAKTTIANAEKAVLKKKDDELKALKKLKSGTDKDIKASQDRVTAEANAQATKATNTIKTAFQTMLPDLAKKAHDAVVKKLGKAAGALKKNHGKAVFKAIMFVVAVTAVVLASVALGPLGGVALGVGIAAVVLKGLSVLGKGISDLRGYIKEWNKVSEKANAEIDSAVLAIDKAVKAMDACHSVRESLKLKIAGAKQELDKAQNGVTGSDKQIANIKKQIADSKKELAALEKFIGDNTGDLLNHLRAAQSSVGEAKKRKPQKVVDNLEKVMDMIDQAAGLAA